MVRREEGEAQGQGACGCVCGGCRASADHRKRRGQGRVTYLHDGDSAHGGRLEVRLESVGLFESEELLEGLRKQLLRARARGVGLDPGDLLLKGLVVYVALLLLHAGLPLLLLHGFLLGRRGGVHHRLLRHGCHPSVPARSSPAPRVFPSPVRAPPRSSSLSWFENHLASQNSDFNSGKPRKPIATRDQRDRAIRWTDCLCSDGAGWGREGPQGPPSRAPAGSTSREVFELKKCLINLKVVDPVVFISIRSGGGA